MEQYTSVLPSDATGEADFRSISAKAIPNHERLKLSPLNPGPAPMMSWVETHLLVVDDSYQRAMGSLAWRHIIAIADAFDWSKFTPVIVAPVEGGFYAIIDGQHRTTAAFLHNIKKVPCCIVQADRAKQAAAFAAINSKIARLYQNNIFHAELQAGSSFAKRVAEVAERAGVKIPRNKMSKKDLPPNAVNAVSSLKAVITTYGDEVTISALQCVTETGDGNAHMLKGVLIRALAEVLSQRPMWRESGDVLFRAFDSIDYQEQIDLAHQDARVGVSTPLSALTRRLGAWLDERSLPLSSSKIAVAAE
ncbi:chromosome partitioning protein ParB [Methylobacterium sp. P1-11]|uniref:ParB N-terminal domain-containing protein n=1 Tax=Methylobacterium sp. P1-11 TaxID=2024616 RepID=UPI0011EC3351|nr:ParB N-terminal domain-containing protein [Methylobacterium sp. P1-11]KAA0122840.1 chromosome partitioning protein ParB [Methylobacterium sp. P1-11]